jgi:hypothetical protein
MKREPTEEELETIAQAIFNGDRVEAINLYLSIKECGLTEAQNHIKALTQQFKASHPDKFTDKRKRDR